MKDLAITVEATMAIDEALVRLAAARGAILDEVSHDVYIKGLSEIDHEIVARACDALGKEPRAEYEPAMPPLPTILWRCRAVQQRDAAPQICLPPAADEPTYRCPTCRDIGWRAYDCPAVKCERTKEHGPHSFVAFCPCRLRANAAAIRLAGQERLQKGQHPGIEHDALVDLEAGRYKWARP